MTDADNNMRMADALLAAVPGTGRIVLSAEELFALSVHLARRIENDPATLKALAEAFRRTDGEPQYRGRRKSRESG